METEITRNEDFFVRNHGGVPEIEPSMYSIEMEGLVNEPKSFSLADLQDEKIFPRQENTVTLQCSGTRRLEQIAQYPGDGDELINVRFKHGLCICTELTPHRPHGEREL